MDVLWFERDWHGLHAAAAWRPDAVAHDHDARSADGRGMVERRRSRRAAQARLLVAERRESQDARTGSGRCCGMLSWQKALPRRMPPPEQTARGGRCGARLRRASRRRRWCWCRSRICSGLEEQPNLPGTIDEHPNWRRRLPLAGGRAARPAGSRRTRRGRSARKPRQ